MSPLALSPEATRRGFLSPAVIGVTCLAAFFAVLPWLVPNYQQVFIAEILIWGLFALSFALVFGYGGMLSFAQAVFFGAGCYGFNVGTYYFGFNTWGRFFPPLRRRPFSPFRWASSPPVYANTIS